MLQGFQGVPGVFEESKERFRGSEWAPGDLRCISGSFRGYPECFRENPGASHETSEYSREVKRGLRSFRGCSAWFQVQA